jgi:hypothetical protein
LLWKIIVKIKMHSSITKMTRIDKGVIITWSWSTADFSPTKELIKANKVCAYLDICSKFLINAKHCYINDVLNAMFHKQNIRHIYFW